MMHWVILPILAVAANLDRGYVPPNAADAGGRDDDLQLPLEPPYIDPYTYDLPFRPDNVQHRDGQIQSYRFLYGSYAYEGPDDVLITVTYGPDRKAPARRPPYPWSDYNRGQSIVPASLPREIQKAFALHKRMQQSERDSNRSRNGSQ